MSWPFRITAPLLDVLEVLVESREELHGWAIMKATKRSGPSIYQVLERLRKAEWVTCRWEDRPPDESRPRRRYYRLTGTGAASARAVLAERRPDRSASYAADSTIPLGHQI
ncbi:PadR family transcriptional regulator [Stackebrandtia nassauensis]|uniref:PadR family transcriptional regulator n=1 Tax=Stackebrandtia nassauensis TaxID=283811 RepID=UPI000A00F508